MIGSRRVGRRGNRVIRVELSNRAYETFNRCVGRYFNSPEEAVIHCMKTMVLLRLKGLRDGKPPRSIDSIRTVSSSS